MEKIKIPFAGGGMYGKSGGGMYGKSGGDNSGGGKHPVHLLVQFSFGTVSKDHLIY